MSTTIPRRSLEECSRIGHEIFDQSIRMKLAAADHGKFVAVEIDGGEFEIDEDDYTAVTRLQQRIPDAEIWLLRVGYPTAYKFTGIRCR